VTVTALTSTVPTAAICVAHAVLSSVFWVCVNVVKSISRLNAPETVDVATSMAVVVVVACPCRKEAMARKRKANERVIALRLGENREHLGCA